MAGTGFKYHSKLQRNHEYVKSTFIGASLKIQACTFQDVFLRIKSRIVKTSTTGFR